MMRPSELRAAALLAVALAAACARPQAPPGGALPSAPPAVVATVPSPLAIDPAFDGAVIFRFDRRISEQAEANPVIVSPATSAVRVSRGRSELRITLEDGWQRGLIYRVVVLPGVRDLFTNRTTEPLELVFSTGPAIPATAIAGIVTDRLTGRPARNAMVEALNVADSVAYITAADTTGFFALRHLPEGVYETVAFADANRNRRRDANDPVSPPERVVLEASTDTVPLLLNVLPPDTTPARLTRADARDTLEVRLQFDDYFDPDADFAAARVQLWLMPDSSAMPAGGELLTTAQLAARRAALLEPRAEPPARAAVPGGAGTGAQQALPARELVFLPAVALQPGAEYVIVVTGVVNIHGIAGGGGGARFTVPARAEPPPD